MAEISDLDPTDANNTGRWPENMLGGTINNAGRADEGILARWYQDTNGSRVASGAGNAFTVTSVRTIGALIDNLVMTFTANHTISGAATLNLNGLGAKAIKRFNGLDLAAGDIVSGQPLIVVYKLAADVWFMMTAPAALTGNMFVDFGENIPAAPGANTARLFARDLGDGITELAWFDSASFTTVLRRALQTDMEGAALVTRLVTPGVQHYHPGHPKAGGNFDGTGAPAFRSGDYGMGAITDGGVGDYTVALDTAFANTNYWVAPWCRDTSTSNDNGIAAIRENGTKTTSSLQIKAIIPGSGPFDSPEFDLSFWGDYA